MRCISFHGEIKYIFAADMFVRSYEFSLCMWSQLESVLNICQWKNFYRKRRKKQCYMLKRKEEQVRETMVAAARGGRSDVCYSSEEDGSKGKGRGGRGQFGAEKE